MKIAKASNVLSTIPTKPSISHWLEYTFVIIFETFLRFLSTFAVDRLSTFMGRTAWIFLKSRRQTVIRNCRIAWGDQLNLDQIQHLSKSVFETNAANLICGMKMALMKDEKITPHVSFSGLVDLHQQLESSPHGILLALAHMGNWEILSRLNALLAPTRSSAAFFRPLNNPLMNHVIKMRRARSGTKLFSNKDGFTQACSHLRIGGLLGILADQNAGNSGIRMPFFGRNTSCSPLLEILHKRTGAAIFYVSMARVDRARWQVTLRKHLQDEYDTSSIMRGIETSLNSSRCDGFWFHNRWKLSVKQPFLVRQTRTSRTTHSQNKPWQIVIVLSNDPKICRATLPAIEQLIERANDYRFFVFNAPIDFQFNRASHVDLPKDIPLRDYLRVLDGEQTSPIDMVIFFTAPDEQFDTRKTSDIPWNAGFSQKYSTLLSTPIPLPTTTLTEPSTWHHFIDALGSKAR
jgi:lauroyl/myristoyl acyltransferase